jgi:pilus assembly protein CpaB
VNVRTMIVGALAVVCGLSAMFLVQALRKPANGPVVERAQVVFSAADIKPGEMVQEAMIELRDIPKSEIPEDAILKASDVIERAAMTQIDKGDMFRQKKLAEKGAGRGMAALIRKGMRAFTITTPSFSSSMAGFILPGNKVDVLLTVNSSGGSEDELGGAATTSLLQNAEILAVHTTVNAPSANKIDPDQARSVTLLVTPDDALLLDLGQNKGTLHLSLRNSKDELNTKPNPLTMANLQLPRTIKPKVVVEPPPPAPVPDPLPPFELSLPETIEVKLTVRTLRGTGAGQDVLTTIKTVPPAKGKTPPSSSSSTSSGIARATSAKAPTVGTSQAGARPSS